MSVIKIQRTAAPELQKGDLKSIHSNIQAHINTTAQHFNDQSIARGVIAMESLAAPERQRVESVIAENFDFLQKEYENHGIKVSNEQLACGAVVMTAFADPVGFHQRAITVNTVSQEGVVLVGVDSDIASQMGYLDGTPSMESFETVSASDFLVASVNYNIQASRQCEFGETFFRTVPLTPEQGGVDMSVRDRLVMNTTQHDNLGSPTDFKERRLLQAAINHKILDNEPLTLVPEVLANGSNAQYFAPASAVANRVVDLGNRTVTTRPLLVGKEVNLIAVAQNTMMAKNGTANNLDMLDNATGVKNLYLRFGNAGEVLQFPIADLGRSAFNQIVEGRKLERALMFVNNSLTLNAKTLLASGAAPTNAALVEIKNQGLTVRLKVRVTGQVDLEYGNAVVDQGSVGIHSIVNAAGEKLASTDPVYDTIAQALAELVVAYWDPDARLTNSNKREEGLLLNSSEYTERYLVPLGQPMSIPSPLAQNRPASDINDLIAAVRLRNSNNAVTKLLSYADALERMTMTEFQPDLIHDLPTIEGIARFLVNPWFRRTQLHLPDHVNGTKSHERLADVSAVLVNTLRDGVYDAYRDSNIKTALDVVTGYTGEKVQVLVGTDPVLSRYLMVPGDERTLAADLPFTKVSTLDARMKDKIVYTFGREGEGLDPLNFGSFLWVTETIQHVQVHRNGANFKEAMVMPRGRHVVHLPIMGIIEVTGLNEVIAGSVPVKVELQPGADAPDAGNGGSGGSDGSGSQGGGDVNGGGQ